MPHALKLGAMVNMGIGLEFITVVAVFHRLARLSQDANVPSTSAFVLGYVGGVACMAFSLAGIIGQAQGKPKLVFLFLCSLFCQVILTAGVTILLLDGLIFNWSIFCSSFCASCLVNPCTTSMQVFTFVSGALMIFLLVAILRISWLNYRQIASDAVIANAVRGGGAHLRVVTPVGDRSGHSPNNSGRSAASLFRWRGAPMIASSLTSSNNNADYNNNNSPGDHGNNNTSGGGYGNSSRSRNNQPFLSADHDLTPPKRKGSRLSDYLIRVGGDPSKNPSSNNPANLNVNTSNSGSGSGGGPSSTKHNTSHSNLSPSHVISSGGGGSGGGGGERGGGNGPVGILIPVDKPRKKKGPLLEVAGSEDSRVETRLGYQYLDD